MQQHSLSREFPAWVRIDRTGANHTRTGTWMRKITPTSVGGVSISTYKAGASPSLRTPRYTTNGVSVGWIWSFHRLTSVVFSPGLVTRRSHP